MAKITGFDDTPAYYSMSTSGFKQSVSFSAAVTAVPETGSSLLMLITGLTGLLVIRRR